MSLKVILGSDEHILIYQHISLVVWLHIFDETHIGLAGVCFVPEVNNLLASCFVLEIILL